jgi:hypothetical protein
MDCKFLIFKVLITPFTFILTVELALISATIEFRFLFTTTPSLPFVSSVVVSMEFAQ